MKRIKIMEIIKKFFIGDRTPAYTNKLPTQILLMCRAIVGGYLLYNDYTIIGNLLHPIEGQEKSGLELWTFIIFAIIFAIFGFVLVYATLINYMIGRYVGGKLDLGDEPSGDKDSDSESAIDEKEAPVTETPADDGEDKKADDTSEE